MILAIYNASSNASSFISFDDFIFFLSTNNLGLLEIFLDKTEEIVRLLYKSKFKLSIAHHFPDPLLFALLSIESKTYFFLTFFLSKIFLVASNKYDLFFPLFHV